MGMKNSSAVFQRCMEQVLKGIPGVIIYQDDVLICAESDRQLKKRLGQVFARLQQSSVTTNKEKCVSATDSLKFLGFIFSESGIQPDPEMTQKIRGLEPPSSPKELASFLGLVTYYGRFIPEFAEICAPLHNAKKVDTADFEWTDECDRSFTRLKEELVSSPVLQPFVMSKDSVVTVDASIKAIGAVLSQEGHPVLYVSRKLSETESRYSNIEREALAVIWACNRLEQFLLGKKFSIETDHKPLIYIFSPNQAVKTEVSPRLLKFSLQMMRYDYDIKHVPGKTNVVADTLSRINHTDTDDAVKPTVHFTVPCIAVDTLRIESDDDRHLAGLRRRIVGGQWGNVSKWEQPFKRMAFQLSIDENNIIRLGSKVVPPHSLYRRIFEVAHQTHNGVNATLRLIQREFFWPAMRQHVEAFVKNCSDCRRARFGATDTTHTWPKDSEPWSRIHMDWAHHAAAGNILIVADSTSGWLEAAVCRDRRTETVIEHLRAIFARFGVPYCLVSDNAPEFTSQQLSMWLSSLSCRLLHSPEYRPQSNGLAERMVRVVKDGLKCYNPAKSSVTAYVHRLLFVHRNTALRDGKTPAELLLGRGVRCPILSHYQPQQQLQYQARRGAEIVPVTFLVRQGKNTSLVAHPGGRMVTAHDAQLQDAGAHGDQLTEPRSDRRNPPRSRAPPARYGEPRSY